MKQLIWENTKGYVECILSGEHLNVRVANENEKISLLS